MYLSLLEFVGLALFSYLALATLPGSALLQIPVTHHIFGWTLRLGMSLPSSTTITVLPLHSLLVLAFRGIVFV